MSLLLLLLGFIITSIIIIRFRIAIARHILLPYVQASQAIVLNLIQYCIDDIEQDVANIERVMH